MKIIIICAAFLLISCGTAYKQPMFMHHSFSLVDYSAYQKTGQGSISGQAFLKQKGGGVVTCAGNDVFLVPDSGYFRELLVHAKMNSNPLNDVDKELIRKVRLATQCDAQGNFVFEQIPYAKWILVTGVNWAVGNRKQGGGLIKYLEITNNKPLKIILSDLNRI